MKLSSVDGIAIIIDHGDFSRKMTRFKLDTVMLSFEGIKFTGKVV